MLNKYAKPILYAVIALGILLAGVLLYFAGSFSGGAEVERKQATEQLRVNEKLRKADERIEQDAPDGSDKSAAIDWLRQHTRQE